MTDTDRAVYRSVARTCRSIARGSLAIGVIAHDKGNHREAMARLRQAREHIREARRWDALAELGA